MAKSFKERKSNFKFWSYIQKVLDNAGSTTAAIVAMSLLFLAFWIFLFLLSTCHNYFLRFMHYGHQTSTLTLEKRVCQDEGAIVHLQREQLKLIRLELFGNKKIHHHAGNDMGFYRYSYGTFKVDTGNKVLFHII